MHRSRENAGSIFIAVCHWPSRYGGAAETEPRRMAVASQLERYLQQAWCKDTCRNILVMGDLNDEPSDPSVQYLTKLQADGGLSAPFPLINLMPLHLAPGQEGTIKSAGYWSIFDQVIVSYDLFSGQNGLQVKNKKAAIFQAAFLLEADNSHLGRKPFRSFLGPAYHRGFSDHLPVYIDINIP